MAVERESGISVASAVMSFEHKGLTFNQPDTRARKNWIAVACEEFEGTASRFPWSGDTRIGIGKGWRQPSAISRTS